MCHVHLVRAVLRNVAKKYHKEIADEIKIALEDETKMQELILELEGRGYSKAADTLEHFRFSIWKLQVVIDNPYLDKLFIVKCPFAFCSIFFDIQESFEDI